MIWVWVSVIVLAAVVEAITDQFVSVWFVPGAIVAAILCLSGIEVVYQVLACVVIAMLGIFVARALIKKYAPGKDTRTNIDAIIGERCIVTEKIDNYAGCGQAKVKGQIWSARAVSDEEVYEEGELLRIVAIEGVKLICKKQ